ncbi:MAG TPA: flavin reductase family protein [Streptosporangiaceae bacterium]|jgi:flavin reductase (DIM6/NTAB) family NADH-FMN oxidoreductase RutF|nr:flavin reductase family protein [Streptosporangiaceae bacterium]
MDKHEPVEVVDAKMNGAAPSVTATELRSVMGNFASGVVIVSGFDRLGPVGLTCQSFFSLSLEPPLVALAPSHASTSWPRIAATGSFAVSILSAAQEDLCRSFAISGIDKFNGVTWRSAHTGSPIIEGALAWVDCRIEAVHEAGDHYLVVARVVHAGHVDGQPLLFYRGGYAAV